MNILVDMRNGERREGMVGSILMVAFKE